jgi:hypothetical protein
MVYLILGVIAASSSLAIIKDRDIFFSCFVRIEAFFVIFPAFRLILAKAVDRFSAVCLVSAKFFV